MVRRSVAPAKEFGDGQRLKAIFQQLLRQVLHHGAGVQALAVGMKDDDASAAHLCSQVPEHPLRGQARIGVPGDSTPENELQTERLCNLYSGVIVLAVRRPEQQPARAIPLLEREDRPADLGALVVFFFKQQTAYDLGLGIPAEPLFRSSGDLQERVLIRHHDYDQCFQSVQLLQWNSQVKFNVTVYRNLPTTRDSIMTS